MTKLAALTLAAAVVATAATASSASAESKSWKAVKKSVSPSANVIAGGNLAAIRGTKLYASAVQLLLTEEPEAQEAFAMIKAECKLDVPAVISDFTAVMKNGEKPLIVIGFDGVDEPRLVGCLEKIIAKKSGKAAKITSKRKGRVSVYTMAGEAKQLHLAWLAKDVLAFTEDPMDKSKLDKLLGKKAAGGQLGKLVAKANTDAVLWAAVNAKEREAGLHLTGGYGAIVLAGAAFRGDVHVALGSADEVKRAVPLVSQALDEAKQQVAKVPALAGMMNSATVGGTGSELDLSATLPDGDIATLMRDFDKIF
ncbi:MAG: hypothetical protein R3B06_14475 [Kofleriaceae bacterium]